MKPVMRREDSNRKPWGLILVLLLCASAGLASLPLQVAVLRQGDAASKADVQRSQDLTRRIAEQQKQNDLEAKQYREDSRQLILAICDQIEAVAIQARLQVPPCPRVPTDPAPTH